MKKVININFQGTVVPIEETSYELLKQYVESLRNYFANEEGRDEIINDIESRISELFQERLKKGSTCITDDDVNAIIANMGRPADFEEAEGGEQSSGPKKESGNFQYTNFDIKGKKLYRDENHKILGGVCSGIAAYIGIEPIIVRLIFIFSGIGLFAYLLLWAFVPGSNVLVNGVRKRLYRNPDEKILGGVCSGIGSYFNINPWIPRALFLVPFVTFFLRWGHLGPLTFPNFLGFSFSPGSLILYIILWLAIPEASSTSEKLEMKGEKVDLNSIKNSVVEEMKGVKERVSKLGKEAGSAVKEKGQEIGLEMHYAARRTGGAIGNIIVTLLKVFAYTVLGSIALALIAVLFTVAIVSIWWFPPVKDFLLTDGWQTVLAWGTLIFFIGVPVVGVITFIIRRIARIKRHNRLMRYSFFGLWILGIICFISLISSVGSDFRRTNSENEDKISLTNPGVKGLEVNSFYSSNKNHRWNNWLRTEPFTNYDDDTVYIPNVRIKIQKSLTDSFQVGVIKMCNGSTRKNADSLASRINFKISQNDSLLSVDRAIAINTTDKFRNQSVLVIIYVPVGHRIKINRNLDLNNYIRINGPWNHYDWDNWDEDDLYYKYGEDYIMREDGLYTLNGIAAGKEDEVRHDDENDDNPVVAPNDENYRYNERNKADSAKGLKDKQTQKNQENADSIKAAQEKQINKMQDSLQKAKEKPEQKTKKAGEKSGPPAEAYIYRGTDNYDFIMHI